MPVLIWVLLAVMLVQLWKQINKPWPLRMVPHTQQSAVGHLPSGVCIISVRNTTSATAAAAVFFVYHDWSIYLQPLLVGLGLPGSTCKNTGRVISLSNDWSKWLIHSSVLHVTPYYEISIWEDLLITNSGQLIGIIPIIVISMFFTCQACIWHISNNYVNCVCFLFKILWQTLSQLKHLTFYISGLETELIHWCKLLNCLVQMALFQSCLLMFIIIPA